MKIINKEVKTCLFDDYLILALSKKWIDAFGELPAFKAMIDNSGKLHLVSTKSLRTK